VVDDLHRRPGVDAGQVSEEREAELGLVVERPDDLPGVARTDPQLGLVVTLANRPAETFAEAALDAAAEGWVHAQTWLGVVGPIARSGQWPRRSLMSCWSFIIP
jgi:hypothetical protein